MKSVVLLSVLLAVALGLSESEYQTAFTNWMQLNQKSYNHDEFFTRYQIFRSNLDFVNKHNAEGHSFTVAINEFADLTAEQFARIYAGMNVIVESSAIQYQSTDANVGLPDSFDWRTKGAVTGVKNQGQCGSCWSFSTTGSTEGCHFISGNSLVGLSEQNLMDCSYSYGNQGCNGGLMTSAMNYIIKNGGIDTESSYPYTAQDGPSCQYSVGNRGATLKSYTNVQSGSEADLQQKVNSGPTSVAIDASHSSFQLYSSGVYYEPACSSSALDHGVLAVGWGVDSGSQYWLVKNSWGTSWGMQGYIEMARNRNNNCGIATMATLPAC